LSGKVEIDAKAERRMEQPKLSVKAGFFFLPLRTTLLKDDQVENGGAIKAPGSEVKDYQTAV